MFKKQQYRSFSKRLTRRIVLALALALIVVAASHTPFGTTIG